MTTNPNSPYRPGPFHPQPPAYSTGPRTSGMAIASLVLGITSIIPTCLGAIVGVVLGIVAIIQINGSGGQQTGTGLAIAGVTLSLLLGTIAPAVILLPAVQQVRAVARQTADQNNIRRIAIASHNFENAHMSLPPSNGNSKRGNGLSWRVHILPFIEQQHLFDQFDFDQPWDSPHNLSLLPKMPDVYKSLGSLEVVEEGHTLFQRPMGNGAIDPGNGERQQFGSIVDGTSNTIMIVEVDASESVPWTKPDDYQFDPNNPLRGLGNNRAQSLFLVGMVDGSTLILTKDISPKTLKAMMTTRGGEIVEMDNRRR